MARHQQMCLFHHFCAAWCIAVQLSSFQVPNLERAQQCPASHPSSDNLLFLMSVLRQGSAIIPLSLGLVWLCALCRQSAGAICRNALCRHPAHELMSQCAAATAAMRAASDGRVHLLKSFHYFHERRPLRRRRRPAAPRQRRLPGES